MSTTYKPVYAASAAVGFGASNANLNALATSSTRTAGAQSDQIDNTTNLYDDILLSGSFKLGTSPTVSKQVDVWVFACKDASSAYPDVITGAGSAAKTLTSENVRNAGGKLLKSILVDSTTGRVYDFSNESVAALFGGVLPQKFVVFVAHDTGVALDASSSGGQMNYLGVQYQGV
jgi:hypothetical protein